MLNEITIRKYEINPKMLEFVLVHLNDVQFDFGDNFTVSFKMLFEIN